jgi:hypothetical protein
MADGGTFRRISLANDLRGRFSTSILSAIWLGTKERLANCGILWKSQMTEASCTSDLIAIDHVHNPVRHVRMRLSQGHHQDRAAVLRASAVEECHDSPGLFIEGRRRLIGGVLGLWTRPRAMATRLLAPEKPGL